MIGKLGLFFDPNNKMWLIYSDYVLKYVIGQFVLMYKVCHWLL